MRILALFLFTFGSLGSSFGQSSQVDEAETVSLDEGWTPLEPAEGATIVYVSSTGDDAADGSEARPRRTIAGGFALLRNGYPDWLLLRRGEKFGLDALQWNKSGPSSGDAWMRLGAYGDESLRRPELSCLTGQLTITPGFQATQTIRRFAITDVHFSAADRLANSATTTSNLTGIQLVAIQWQGTGFPFSDILLENCRISGFTSGFASGTDVTNLSIRRCIFDHLFGARTTHAGGVLGGATNWLMEDNLFYQIMSPDIPGVGANAYSPFSHSVYVTAEATNVVSRRNICIKCPDGPMQRAGGVFVQNVTAHTNIAANVGQAWGVTPVAGGVEAQVRENLALNTIGGNFFLGNVRAGSVQSNLLLQDLDGQRDITLMLVPQNLSGSGSNIGVHNTEFASNIVSGAINWNSRDPASFSRLTFSANRTGIGQTPTSIAQYLQALGWSGSTIDDWAAHLMRRDRNLFTMDHSAVSVINFYRAHYGLPRLP